MKKEYKKPQVECFAFMYSEIMNSTSKVPMDGTTDTFDAKTRYPFNEETEEEFNY